MSHCDGGGHRQVGSAAALRCSMDDRCSYFAAGDDIVCFLIVQNKMIVCRRRANDMKLKLFQ